MSESTSDVRIEPYFPLPHGGTSIEFLRQEESRLAKLGKPDPEATQAFQSYPLPGSEFVSERSGEPISVAHALIDPGAEYVVRVQGPKTYDRLLRFVRSNNVVDVGDEHVMYSPLEIIYGSIGDLSHCYRQSMFDGEISKSDARLHVEGNVEHEKDQSGYYGRDPNHEGMLYGTRTGRVIAHQRRPSGMTRFVEDRGVVELSTDDPIWVVVPSARWMEQRNHESG